MRSMLARALTRAGFVVLEASNGRDGRRIAAASPVDLLVTDIIMPGEEGIETILHLRKSQPGLRIIAMSGGGRLRKEGYLDLAAACGAHGVLGKPFDIATFLGMIEDVLRTPPPAGAPVHDPAPPTG